MSAPVPLLFIDTETTGLRRPGLPDGRRIWEIGGVRVEPDGTEYPLHLFIRIEELGLAEMLPAEVVAGRLFDRDDNAEWYGHLPETVREGLEIGGFHERHPQLGGSPDVAAPLCSEKSAAATLVAGPWLRDRPTLVGAVPMFEDLGLFDLLHRTGYIGPDDQPWHYHLVDVETLVAGALGWPPPWNSDDLSIAVGVDPDRFNRHTAVDDAWWARALYEAALTRGRNR
jgi:DNA polymerase III epsilon subunit-like protein